MMAGISIPFARARSCAIPIRHPWDETPSSPAALMRCLIRLTDSPNNGAVSAAPRLGGADGGECGADGRGRLALVQFIDEGEGASP